MNGVSWATIVYLFNILVSDLLHLLRSNGILRYSVQEFAEIEHVQREDFVEVKWRSS